MEHNDQPCRVRIDVGVPMRDGVRLSADVYLPARGERFPVLLLRTVYDNAGPRYVAWAMPFVRAGYGVVLEDCRGRFDSEGTWAPYTCEAEDGYDTQEWIARQAWCDGSIGTFGVSYSGFTQTTSATLRSPHLRAMVPIASQQDNYGHHRMDGVVHLGAALWFSHISGRTMQSEPLALLDPDALARRLPLSSALDDIVDLPYYRGVIEHEEYDEFWSSYSLRERYGDVDVPAYFMTGWFDSLLRETLTVFGGWRGQARSPEARTLTRLLIGPWSHAVSPWGAAESRALLGPGGEYADVSFGPDAIVDNASEHLRWFDARLRGIATGIDHEPPVRLFVMGENVWRGEHEWPLARTRWTDVYLHSGGAAATAEGDGTLSFEPPVSEPSDHFTYDPADPVPSWGAQYQEPDRDGPRDRRAIEARRDVLVYTSAPLAQDLEVTGPVSAVIHADSDAPDTDITAALVDVHPDGRAVILCEGIRRGRFRGPPLSAPDVVPVGSRPFTVDLWSTANLFRAGHRIRLEVSSSNFPRFARNLNTGERDNVATAMRVAAQTVHHDSERPSHLILPVIPRG